MCTGGQCVEQRLTFGKRVGLEVDRHVVPGDERVAHRLDHVGAHEDRAAEDGQRHVHHLVLDVFGSVGSVNVDHALQGEELTAEDLALELERLLGGAHEVEVDRHAGHGTRVELRPVRRRWGEPSEVWDTWQTLGQSSPTLR